MTINVVMLRPALGGDGTEWRRGNTYAAADDFARALIGRGDAHAADYSVPDVAPGYINAAGDIIGPDGAVYGLSEVIPEVTPTPSATTNYSSKKAYAGYRCTTAAGNITITCVTTSKVLVPLTALVVGAFPAYGAGHSGRIAIETGDGDVRVVLSGASVVYVGLE